MVFDISMKSGVRVTYKELAKQHLSILKGLQYESGLFAASAKDSKTGYEKSWLRDNFYECLAFLVMGDHETVKRTYKALLKLFLKHEYKLDWAIEQKPEHKYQYIHARYHPETFDEFWEDWGNKQHDAVGAILFGIGELKSRYGVDVVETDDERRIVEKLAHYLGAVMYWADPDSGMWEEDEELHASSIGACVAGLRSVKKNIGVRVPAEYIRNGKAALAALLPRESKRKFVDLALLSLIYPYNVVTARQRDEIIENVTYHLERKRGVIRYKGDHYYNRNEDGYSEEAEWTFGLSWLAVIFERMGKKKMAQEYIEKAIATINRDGVIPELYFSNSRKFNENTPLGWAESMFVIALYCFNRKHGPKFGE